jgi:hypothetical protein
MPTRFRSIRYFRFTLSPADLELLASGMVNIVQIVGAKFDGDLQFGGLSGGVWAEAAQLSLAARAPRLR